MRVFLAPLLIAVLAGSLSPAGAFQIAITSPQALPRPRIIAELSDTLLHSRLEPCNAIGEGPAPPARARVATWNIQGARTAPVEMIADEIHAMQADVVALQEVDIGTRRGGLVEQPTELARALGYHYAFAAAIKWDGGDYGLAFLSRWPLSEVRRHRLETVLGAEPRIVLEATVCVGGRRLVLFNHHADGRPATRQTGLEQVRGVLEPHIGRGILVAGDFNETTDGPGVSGLVQAGLVDLGSGTSEFTTSGGRIDLLLADRVFASHFAGLHVWPTSKSDHNAVVAEFDWQPDAN